MSPRLDGLRVWCTRPGAAGTRSAGRLEHDGASVLHLPTLRIEPVAADRSGSLAADTVVGLTSPAATTNFVAAWGPVGPDGAPWRAFAIGPRTAQQAQQLGLEVVGISPRATGADFGPALLASTTATVVVLPGSDRRSPALGAQLREAGREVIELLVQRTVPVESCPPQQDLDALDLVVAWSPSALAFTDSLDAAQRASVLRIPVAALGPTTAARARELGTEVVVAPDQPSEDRMLADIASWWTARRA